MSSKLVFILVMVGTMLLSAALLLWLRLIPKWNELAASSWARNLELAAAAYHEDHGQWPPAEPRELVRTLGSGAGLTRPDKESDTPRSYLGDYPIMQERGIPVDPWENPMIVTFDGKQIRVISAGPDGRPGSADDIDSSFARTEAKKIEAKHRK